jgi:hypothetical protein
MSSGPTSKDIKNAEKITRRRLKGALIEPFEMARAVASMGGINYVVQKRKWQAVREKLNLPQTSSSGNTLYRVWKLYFPKYSGQSKEMRNETSDSESESTSSDEDDDDDDDDDDDVSSSDSTNSSDVDSEDSSDGEGGDSDSSGDEIDGSGGSESSSYTNTTSSSFALTDVDRHESECQICREPGELLCCDFCTRVYHIYCLTPPLKYPPTTDWKCPICIKTKSVAESSPFSSSSFSRKSKRKRSSPSPPRVDQSTFSSNISPIIIETIQRLNKVYEEDEELELWEFHLISLMLHDRSPEVKTERLLALVQAALDDYELSQMALDLSHTLSRIFLSVYEIGWHPKRNKKKSKR